jgi:hypothetical protein
MRVIEEVQHPTANARHAGPRAGEVRWESIAGVRGAWPGAVAKDDHRKRGTVAARDRFRMKAVMWIPAPPEPTSWGLP